MTKKLSPSQSEKGKTEFSSFVPKINLEDFVYLLILAFLPTQFGKHFWPNFSYISGIRIDYLSPTIYFTDILILTLLLLVFIKSFKNGIFKSVKKHRTLLTHLFLISIFMLFNIVFSKNTSAAIYGTIKFFELVFFGVFTFYKIRHMNINLLLTVFSACIIFESLLSIFEYIKQSSLGGIFYFFGERTFTGQTPGIANISVDGNLILRAYGTFSHPNVLAGFLLIFLVFILFNLNIKKISNSFYLTAIILGSIGLFLTFSRIAIMLWVLSLFIFTFSKVKINLKQRISIMLMVITSLIVSFIFYYPFYFRFFQTSFFEDSLVLREKLIFQGLDKFGQSPIFGAGLNNYFSNFVSLKSVFVLQPVHNIYILVLIQTGVVGFAYFLWFLYKTFLKAVKTKPLFLKLIFFYIILIGLFDHYFLTLQQGQLLFSFFMGAILSKND